MNNTKYNLYPINVMDLVNTLINVCDDFKKGELPEQDMEKLLIHYTTTHPKMFIDGKLNSTVKLRIGKSRVRLLGQVLRKNGLVKPKEI